MRASSWIPFLLGAVAGLAVWGPLLGLGWCWLSTRRPTETIFQPVSLGYVTVEPLPETEPGQHDYVGNPRYAERVHELVSNERVAPDDAFVQVRVDDPYALVAVLSAGEMIWAKESPGMNTRYWLDVKPGEYELEVDGYLEDGTVEQRRAPPFRVEVERPLRFRPKQWLGEDGQ